MGANLGREAQYIQTRLEQNFRCSGVYRANQQTKAIIDAKRSGPSPRDVIRAGELRERKLSFDRPTADAAVSSSAVPIEAPEREVVEGSESKPLQLEDDTPLQVEDEKEPETPKTRGRCSVKMLAWHDKWMHSVECGELDIYTCLGLSDMFSFGEDTRRILCKVISCCVLQLVVPVILLYVELDEGFSYQPKLSDSGFRVMGVCLYLYSLYSMYNNALDECRSDLLTFAFAQKVPSGYWLPMLIGELINVFVSLILVMSLFVIFVGTTHPADLILNAVAVNFLGAIDGEFVSDVMQDDALTNFKQLFYEYGADGDIEAKPGPRRRMLFAALSIMMGTIKYGGLFLSFVFLVAPSPSAAQIAQEANFTSSRSLGAVYPRFV